MNAMKILVPLLMMCTVLSCTQEPEGNQETQKIVDGFFKTYKAAGPKEAIVSFLAMNKWVTNDDANNVAVQMNEVISQVGKYYGQEKITVSTYGNNVIQYVYIAKYERQPLKFIFRFYRPGDVWQVQSFNYEVDFIKELDEAGKGYRLKENMGY